MKLKILFISSFTVERTKRSSLFARRQSLITDLWSLISPFYLYSIAFTGCILFISKDGIISIRKQTINVAMSTAATCQ